MKKSLLKQSKPIVNKEISMVRDYLHSAMYVSSLSKYASKENNYILKTALKSY